MAAERRQFPQRWPHLTTLYNASPFISRGYKDVEDWNSLRPLPPIVGGYPPSYDDTYSRSNVSSYVGGRQFAGEKFGRSFVTAPPSNYDAFSLSTYQSLPIKRNNKKSRTTGCLSFCIGLSLIISLIGAVVALVIVLNSGDKCDTYRDTVYVVDSPYDHSQLLVGSDIYDKFSQDFCTEIETAFELFFTEDHICGCLVDHVNVQELFVNVTFNILYRRINATDGNATLVGASLGNIMYTILNDTLIDRFTLSNVVPTEAHVTKTPMASIGNWSTTTTQDTPTLVSPSTQSHTLQSSNSTATPIGGSQASRGTTEGLTSTTIAASKSRNQTTASVRRTAPPAVTPPRSSQTTQSLTTPATPTAKVVTNPSSIATQASDSLTVSTRQAVGVVTTEMLRRTSKAATVVPQLPPVPEITVGVNQAVPKSPPRATSAPQTTTTAPSPVAFVTTYHPNPETVAPIPGMRNPAAEVSTTTVYKTGDGSSVRAPAPVDIQTNGISQTRQPGTTTTTAAVFSNGRTASPPTPHTYPQQPTEALPRTPTPRIVSTVPSIVFGDNQRNTTGNP